MWKKSKTFTSCEKSCVVESEHIQYLRDDILQGLGVHAVGDEGRNLHEGSDRQAMRSTPDGMGVDT